MASVYTDEAAMTVFIAGDGTRLTNLLDRDRDGAADPDVLDGAIGNAGTAIDASLGQRWPVPFNEITGSPATPEIIQLCAKHLVAAELYAFIDPDGNDTKRHEAKAQAILDKLLDGTYTIPGVDPLGGEEARRVAITYSADEPQFSGRDADGNRRWRGM